MTITLMPPQGWQCPACGGVYAPWVARCGECKPKTLRDRMAATRPPTPQPSGPLPLIEGGGTDATVA